MQRQNASFDHYCDWIQTLLRFSETVQTTVVNVHHYLLFTNNTQSQSRVTRAVLAEAAS